MVKRQRPSDARGSVLIRQDEGDLHVHPIGRELAVLDDDFLVLDPGNVRNLLARAVSGF